MTAPLPDDPFEGLPTAPSWRQAAVREVIGLVWVLLGLVVVGGVLLTVDPRWVIGLGGAVLIAAGLWLGRVPDDEGE